MLSHGSIGWCAHPIGGTTKRCFLIYSVTVVREVAYLLIKKWQEKGKQVVVFSGIIEVNDRFIMLVFTLYYTGSSGAIDELVICTVNGMLMSWC